MVDDETLVNFLAITESNDPAAATNFLEAANYDLSQAVALYFASQASGGGHSSSSLGTRKSDDYFDEHGVRRPDEIKRAKLIDESELTFIETTAYDTRFQQKHKKGQSVFSGGGFIDPQSLSGKEKTLATLFRAPTEIMTHRPFDECLELGKEDDRWVIANIQKESEFASYLLNRDFWAEEGVQEMIQCSFIFWQQLDISSEAMKYCTRYKIKEFPHIAIVNPRTGALVWRKEGDAIKVNSLAEQIQDFLGASPSPKESNPASLIRFANRSSSNAVRPPPPPTHHLTDPNDNNNHDEEEEIAKAIALSLTQSTSDKDVEEVVLDTSPKVKQKAATPIAKDKPFTGFTSEMLSKVAETPSSTSTGVISIKVKVQNGDGGPGVFLLRLADDVTVGKFLLDTLDKLPSKDKKFDVFFGHPQQKLSESLKLESEFSSFSEKLLTELGILSNTMVIVRMM